jgi:FMN phosphatase YigB (HAD superfamily)
MLTKLGGLQPHECVFIDDLESNVKGANQFGLTGICVSCYIQMVFEIMYLSNFMLNFGL